MHSHTERQNCRKPAEGITSNGVWNKHFHKGSSTSRCTAEPTGRNAQIALFIHKQCSMADSQQNQLAKGPSSALCSKEICPGSHWWTYWVLELVSSSKCMSLFHQRKACQQPVPSREEIGRIPKTNGFCSWYESPSKYSSGGQLAMSSWLIATILACCSSCWLLKTQRSQMSWEHSLTLGAKKLLPKVGVLLLAALKPIQRPGT